MSDRAGYRYDALDPEHQAGHGRRCPLRSRRSPRARPNAAGFETSHPMSASSTVTKPGTRLSLHQDRDERDYDSPIVSVSLGVRAMFLFGGLRRSDQARRGCGSNTVMSLSGVDRRGCAITASAARGGVTSADRPARFNLTFRKAM